MNKTLKNILENHKNTTYHCEKAMTCPYRNEDTCEYNTTPDRKYRQRGCYEDLRTANTLFVKTLQDGYMDEKTISALDMNDIIDMLSMAENRGWSNEISDEKTALLDVSLQIIKSNIKGAIDAITNDYINYFGIWENF